MQKQMKLMQKQLEEHHDQSQQKFAPSLQMITTKQIRELGDDNWDAWSEEIETILIHHNLWTDHIASDINKNDAWRQDGRVREIMINVSKL